MIVAFETLIGKTFNCVERTDYDIKFHSTDGKVYTMCHMQDCCEQVFIESITGDLDDLVGTPILLAEEASNNSMSSESSKVMYNLMPNGPLPGSDESYSWTFYKLGTIKGYVDIRWYGSSNGYYSESVDLYED